MNTCKSQSANKRYGSVKLSETVQTFINSRKLTHFVIFRQAKDLSHSPSVYKKCHQNEVGVDIFYPDFDSVPLFTGMRESSIGVFEEFPNSLQFCNFLGPDLVSANYIFFKKS